MYVIINDISFENASGQQLEKFVDTIASLQKQNKLINVEIIKPQNIDFNLILKNIIRKSVLKSKYIPLFLSIVNRARLEETLNEFIIHNNGDTLESLACAIAFDFDQTIVSVASIELWKSQKIAGEYFYLDNDGNVLCNKTAEVNNIADESHISTACLVVSKNTMKKVSSGYDFWEKRCKLLPDFIFCGDTQNQIKKLSLMRLNALFNHLINFEHIKHKDSSQSVRNNPSIKRNYKFTLPDGTKEYFFWHFNLSQSERVHYLIKEGKRYIGYIGKHLSTKKNK